MALILFISAMIWNCYVHKKKASIQLKQLKNDYLTQSNRNVIDLKIEGSKRLVWVNFYL